MNHRDSVSWVWDQILAEALTSFSAFHRFNDLTEVLRLGSKVLHCLALALFFQDLTFLPPSSSFCLFSVSGLRVRVVRQPHPLGEANCDAAGLRAGSHQPGWLVTGQASHPEHTQWYDAQTLVQLQMNVHNRRGLLENRIQVFYSAIFSSFTNLKMFEAIMCLLHYSFSGLNPRSSTQFCSV